MFRNITHSTGVTVTAVTQDRESDMSTTLNSERQYSPVPSLERPMAPKASTATAVAPSSGTEVCPTTSMPAASAAMPFCILTITPSTTTMALSTSMPSAMTRAPSEIRSRATSHGPMKMKVPQMVNARTKPMIRLLRRPMKSTSTPMTMATASTRLTRKALIAVVVAADWSEAMPASTPSGT
ncbi:MAG: hypothetical protein JRG85_13920 [Deltaproteobacteria bacterium]|nr:hypothetical protein [Deltaproteobacteria bacterium]